MTESDLKLIDFHVTDITCHVNTGVSEELPMSIKSSVSARMPEEFDGSLYIYLKTTITGQDESLFLLDVLTETIVRLPEGKTELDENDAPPCITFARRRSSSGVTAREKPRKSVLSGLQSTTYHISVLPCSPFSRQADASDGCT